MPSAGCEAEGSPQNPEEGVPSHRSNGVRKVFGDSVRGVRAGSIRFSCHGRTASPSKTAAAEEEITMKNHQPKSKKKIPPPPGDGASYDEWSAYCSKYPLDQLAAAGYAEEASPDEVRDLENAATFQLLCDYGLRLKLPRALNEQLVLLAARKKTSVAKLVRMWIMQN